jgi:uncharacterized membrane protein
MRIILSPYQTIYANGLKIAYVLLFIWCWLGEYMSNTPVLGVKSLPIALCLWGILKLNSRSLQWGAIFLNLYFMEGVVSIATSKYPYNKYGAITLLIASMAYIFTLLYLAPYKKYAKIQKRKK